MPGGKGGYDIYTAVYEEINQSIKGRVLDLETKIKTIDRSLKANGFPEPFWTGILNERRRG